MERLQKLISEYGYCSRRKAEELILDGKVYVNNKKVNTLGTKCSKSDIIMINNTILKPQEKVYYMFNKPREVITSAHDDKHRKTIFDYIDLDTRVYPVGRLDYDTTGLIILTNDGELANKITRPSSRIEKTYIAKINKILTKEDIKVIKKGIMVDGRKCMPDHIKTKKIVKDNSIVEITIHDGRNHEIKKIFEYLHIDVLKLTRISYGNIKLGNLKSGEYRKINIKDIKILYSLIKK